MHGCGRFAPRGQRRECATVVEASRLRQRRVRAAPRVKIIARALWGFGGWKRELELHARAHVEIHRMVPRVGRREPLGELQRREEQAEREGALLLVGRLPRAVRFELDQRAKHVREGLEQLTGKRSELEMAVEMNEKSVFYQVRLHACMHACCT